MSLPLIGIAVLLPFAIYGVYSLLKASHCHATTNYGRAEHFYGYHDSPWNTKVQYTSQECVICCDSEADHVILDCRHCCLCEKCANKLQRNGDPLCPLCRGPIDRIIRIYSS
ncbi:unnamed protein product [Clavelina lepadiformis]|uniref:RING-type domain-containing protein n=1 Tax=Clavelina lepadiformis TaxID=159417 RepID=A0ABP0FE18_CLALP